MIVFHRDLKGSWPRATRRTNTQSAGEDIWYSLFADQWFPATLCCWDSNVHGSRISEASWSLSQNKAGEVARSHRFALVNFDHRTHLVPYLFVQHHEAVELFWSSVDLNQTEFRRDSSMRIGFRHSEITRTNTLSECELKTGAGNHCQWKENPALFYSCCS